MEEDYKCIEVELTAPDVDMSTFLEDGEIDVTHMELEDIRHDLPENELVNICKSSKAFLGPFGPVGLMRTGITKRSRITMEACAEHFDCMTDMILFMKEHKGILVYTCLEIKVPTEKYVLRYFHNDNIGNIQIGWVTYFWNRITEWKQAFNKGIRRIKEKNNENMR